MSNSKRAVVALVAAMIALAVGVYVGIEARTPLNQETSLPPDAITHLFATRLIDSNGQPQALSQWQGKVLVINFWATWCPPCREEMPAFSRLQSKYAANGVQFVGIALDTADNVTSFSKLHPVDYPLLVASAEGPELTRRLGNSQMALPYTVVFTAQGAARFARLGRVSEDELDALLHKTTAP